MARGRNQDRATDLDMTGKTVLFTGASRGMGHYAATELARRGAQILIVGHNQTRGTAAVSSIRATGGSAQFLHADMGDARQVCRLADTVLSSNSPIDILVHSAGGLAPSGARTHEGVDRGFAQNFLGAYLLTRLLEELLLACGLDKAVKAPLQDFHASDDRDRQLLALPHGLDPLRARVRLPYA